jgi:hypothetical protein
MSQARLGLILLALGLLLLLDRWNVVPLVGTVFLLLAALSARIAWRSAAALWIPAGLLLGLGLVLAARFYRLLDSGLYGPLCFTATGLGFLAYGWMARRPAALVAVGACLGLAAGLYGYSVAHLELALVYGIWLAVLGLGLVGWFACRPSAWGTWLLGAGLIVWAIQLALRSFGIGQRGRSFSLLFGIGLVFGLLYLMRGERHQLDWTIGPAIALALTAVLALFVPGPVALARLSDWLPAIVLITAGAALLLRARRPALAPPRSAAEELTEPREFLENGGP